MRMKNDNRGMSLVEMLVAVMILSIIMASVGWILTVMSRNFAMANREVQLQNTVQTTYAVISDYIKEAQSEDDSIQSVYTRPRTDGSDTYIVVDVVDPISQEPDIDKSFFMVISYYNDNAANGKRKLYMWGGPDMVTSKLYDINGNRVDYLSYKAPINADCYLANNVEVFNVDTTYYEDGYVVLAIKCKYGDREASISQNIYLRNANISAEWGITGEYGNTEDLYDGYHVIGVDGYTNTATPYSSGQKIKLTTITLAGTLEADDNPEDYFHVDEIPAGMITGLYENEDGTGDNYLSGKSLDSTKDLFFTFKNSSYVYKANFPVTVGSGGATCGAFDMSEPALTSASTNSALEVTYAFDSKTSTGLTATGSINKTVTVADYNYCCPNCGTVVTPYNKYNWDGSLNSVVYKCTNSSGYHYDWGYGACSYTYNENDISTAVRVATGSSHTENNTYQTGTGKIYIKNISETFDYSNVKVILYFKDNAMSFAQLSSDANVYLGTFNVDGSTVQNRSVTYSVTAPSGQGITDFIEVDVGDLPCGNAVDGYATIGLSFKWALPSGVTLDPTQIAVFSITTG